MAVPSLHDLRRTLAPWHHREERRLALGAPVIDAALGGGLPLGAIHELHPSRPLDHGAVTGFAWAIAALANQEGKPTIWIQHDFASIEAGALYGADFFGLPLSSLVVVHVPRVIDALWALEETLKCPAVAAVVAEIDADGDAVDLTATRRLSLAARDGGGFGLLLRHRPSAMSSAVTTRWEVASVAGARDQFGGFGRTTFAVSLIKNRCGRCGCWIISWDQHERAFTATLSLGVAQTARDRSARALSTRAA
jgi:protein ImuA